MANYIFFTPEGVTLNPHGDEIENCQLMGRASGSCIEEALNNLLDENPWIRVNGFSPSEFIAEEIVYKDSAD